MLPASLFCHNKMGHQPVTLLTERVPVAPYDVGREARLLSQRDRRCDFACRRMMNFPLAAK
jgi:hypothetical protein